MYLTKRQFDVLKVLDALCAKGYSPTQEEIGKRTGMSSSATVHKHLQNLKRKGLATWEYNCGRSLEITREGRKALESKSKPKSQTVAVPRICSDRRLCPNCQEVLVA